MLTKTIKISQSTHAALSELASKKDTFNDVINHLIEYYYENEEFTDEEAEYCNTMIDNLEKEDYTDTYTIDTDNLDKELDKLEAKEVI